MPENADLMALYRGEEARGARLVDDPVLPAKVLSLPSTNTRLTLEKSRLRIDDELGAPLEKSRLAKDARRAYDALFSKCPISAWGVNLDIYFQTRNLVPLDELFSPFFGDKALSGADLLDVGIQFTIKKGNYSEVWFLKVTGPLEIAVHVNRHFDGTSLPDEKVMHEVLLKCYNEADDMMSHFALG